MYVIRKRIKLAPDQAIFIFVDEVLPPTAALMSSIYEEHKDEDGFLYITYSGENTCACRSDRSISLGNRLADRITTVRTVGRDASVLEID